jgi:hypothetical protein
VFIGDVPAGSIVPDWGGPRAGLPGKGFAKVLRDAQTGESPVMSYWKQALIVSDNRIPAMGNDTSAYVYAAPAAGSPVTITVELCFRRAFQAVMDARGWNTSDIVMEEIYTTLHVQPWWRVFLPVVVRDVLTPERSCESHEHYQEEAIRDGKSKFPEQSDDTRKRSVPRKRYGVVTQC